MVKEDCVIFVYIIYLEALTNTKEGSCKILMNKIIYKINENEVIIFNKPKEKLNLDKKLMQNIDNKYKTKLNYNGK